MHRLAGVEPQWFQHITRHDRALREPRRFDGALLRPRRITADNAVAVEWVIDQVDEGPPERGEEVGHRGDVYERHVVGNSGPAYLRRLVGPPVNDTSKERVLLRIKWLIEGLAGDQSHLRQGRPFVGLAIRCHGRHHIGTHEGLGPIKSVEGRDQAVEIRPARRSRPTPGSEANAVADTAGEGEKIEGSGRTELVDSCIQSLRKTGQLSKPVVAVEEFVWKGAPAREDLVRQLAAEHAEVGQALAGRLLGQRVERGNPGR